MTKYSISATSELIKNYKQAETMAPDANFEALQTTDGLSLLFSIGTDGAFYVTAESPGHKTGWERICLTRALCETSFPGNNSVQCKLFSLAQNKHTNSIDCGIVINDGKNDHLFVSVDNPCGSTSWLHDLKWKNVSYDHPHSRPSVINITGLMISDSSDGEYIIADISTGPDSGKSFVERYYIDIEKMDGLAWHSHNLTAHLETDQYLSCLGRKKDGLVDGVYTTGKLGNDVHLIYQPLYNAFDPDLYAAPSRLRLPGNLLPEAMATCRKQDDSTDLFLTASGGLYWFPSDRQSDYSEAVLLFKDQLFKGVKRLFASANSERATVWGLNRSNQVFYISCPVKELHKADSWSVPVPLLANVYQISPYINLEDGSNTFFANIEGDTLLKAAKSADTSLWGYQRIILEAKSIRASTRKFTSYTTRIQLSDEQKQGIAEANLSISTNFRTKVYINNVYYVLDTEPIEVKTDYSGALTVVEAVSGLLGATITVGHTAAEPLEICPMDKQLAKLAALDSPERLKAANFTDESGNKRKLLRDGIDAKKLEHVAAMNRKLGQEFRSLRLADADASASLQLAAASTGLTDPGDLFSWIKSGVTSVIESVVSVAKNAWEFVVNVAGKIYRTVLDCAEQIAAAVEQLFSTVAAAIKDVINYLEYLFAWGDIRRTKEVYHHLTRLYLDEQIESVRHLKGKFDGVMSQVIKSVNEWADITDWTGIGESADKKIEGKVSPLEGQEASSMMIINHFKDNAANITEQTPGQPSIEEPGVFDVLLEVLKREGDLMSEVFRQFQTLAESYQSLTLSEILKKIVAILANTLLSTVQVVIDALLDILYILGKAALRVLDTKIHIPVVSDILNAIGVEDMSMLDLICWIGAVPATIMYKVLTGSAPFTDSHITIDLKNAVSLEEALAAGQLETAEHPEPEMEKAGMVHSMSLMTTSSVAHTNLQRIMFITGHSLSAICSFINFPFVFADTLQEQGSMAQKVSSALSIVMAATSYLGNYFLGICASKDAVWKGYATTMQSVRLVSRVVFWSKLHRGAEQSSSSSLKLANYREIGAIFDSFLVLFDMIGTVVHFCELAKLPDNEVGKKEATYNEMANVVGYFSRITYMVAVKTSNPKVKVISGGFSSGCHVVIGSIKVGIVHTYWKRSQPVYAISSI
ncbi:hypothetical protein [Chitinophaga sancti]|uniref:Uncharacterized protein n=1 Tax=Chitinophaga sancti TaxID=1004 RepID=A0A1K1SCI6_9BACT|nr:hypothetical protein [Chitinophaga sancti]WQD63596.1 hypothetical protein U0033_04255 [Chitinophaga sancti]WQG90778.1 hypothetical protein SR876_04660 [Chitinophaga sancti]SFW81946.1 hypothetical protein SAMN05661012_05168 [Chitinophaga sancti]